MSSDRMAREKAIDGLFGSNVAPVPFCALYAIARPPGFEKLFEIHTPGGGGFGAADEKR